MSSFCKKYRTSSLPFNSVTSRRTSSRRHPSPRDPLLPASSGGEWSADQLARPPKELERLGRSAAAGGAWAARGRGGAQLQAGALPERGYRQSSGGAGGARLPEDLGRSRQSHARGARLATVGEREEGRRLGDRQMGLM
jgi:hypothetical protein